MGGSNLRTKLRGALLQQVPIPWFDRAIRSQKTGSGLPGSGVYIGHLDRYGGYIPISLGRNSVISGMYVIIIRKTSAVSNHGITAFETSVRPSFEIAEPT